MQPLAPEHVRPRYTGGPGSNRDPRAHAEALRAAVELVDEVGYAKVSMEAIAKRAGVGKPTLYRWWPNKASLVHEALVAGPIDFEFSYVYTGSLVDDLRAFIDQTIRWFSHPVVYAAWPGVVADLRADEPAWRKMYQTFTEPASVHLASLLEMAAARGEARADVDASTVFDAILGSCMNEVMTPGRLPSRKGWVDRVLDLVLGGIRP
ncbi:MAG: TetR/AcrR family transcriptional regulator [Actinobacteria bacterium]|nr:TetR/AcrR family transcriptional regulator [Actinomycetota bacterium]